MLVAVFVRGSSAFVRAEGWFLGLSIMALAAGCSGDKSTGTAPPSGVNTPQTSGGSGSSAGASGRSSTGRGAADAGIAGPATPTATAGRSESGAGASGAGASGTASGGMSGGGGNAGESAGAGAGVGGAAGAIMDAGVPMDDEDGGVCMPLENPLTLGGFPRCSAELCPGQDSICLAKTTLIQLVPQSTVDLLADCNANDKCVPQSFAEQGGKGILPSCLSLNGAEGRCTSQCVPQVAVQAKMLPKDVCTGNDLCAPCFDPRTGEDTLACRQGCDPGPKDPPKNFDECCSSRGLCVPPSLAAEQAANLAKDTCTGENLCAPKELTDPTYKPISCYSLDNAEGRCLSTCVGGAVARQKDRLPTAGCGMDEVCAPCYDPITGDDTGACTVNGDKPNQPKYQFAKCCDSGAGAQVGVCVPPELAGAQADILQQDTCASGKLCAPTNKAENPNFRFRTCDSILGEGACVPTCILPAAERALLSRTICEQGELCAPCEVLGEPSGACE
jgi:hypothetical protein